MLGPTGAHVGSVRTSYAPKGLLFHRPVPENGGATKIRRKNRRKKRGKKKKKKKGKQRGKKKKRVLVSSIVLRPESKQISRSTGVSRLGHSSR
eukprot:1818678-Rhodomonas_salina.1